MRGICAAPVPAAQACPGAAAVTFDEARAEAIPATLKTRLPASQEDAERFTDRFEREFSLSPMYEAAAGRTYFVWRVELELGHRSVAFGVTHRSADLLLRVTQDDGEVGVPEVVYCAINRNDDVDDCLVVPTYSTRPLTATETEAIRSRLAPNAHFEAMRADVGGHA